MVAPQPNKPLAIECPVESRPESSISWFKDNHLLGDASTHLDMTGNNLLFIQFGDSDAGEYYCEAENYLGSARSESFKLSVASSKYKHRQRERRQKGATRSSRQTTRE